jgi:hypothetical protein
MQKNIEYEKNGVKKFAQERFKDALISEGWNVVEDKKKVIVKAKKKAK